MDNSTKYDELWEGDSAGDFELSSWESEFLESIERQLDNLTTKQQEKLDELYEEHCA